MKISLARYRTISIDKSMGLKRCKPRYDWSKKRKRRGGWKA